MPVGAVIAEMEADKRRRPTTRAFDLVVERHDKVLDYQFGLGRWIMASLVVVNGGALLALLNAADKYPGAMMAAGPVFVVGLVLALLGGSVAWLNCNFVTAAADERLDWEALDIKKADSADTLDWWAWSLAWLAVLFTFASLAAFPIGAWEASRAVSQHLSATRAAAPTLSDEQMRVLDSVGLARPVDSK